MSMLEYVQEIQRQLITVYGFAENPQMPGLPMDVPDGAYPMTIEGKRDNVTIENGKINCLNFDQ
jgi:hypothetical protein